MISPNLFRRSLFAFGLLLGGVVATSAMADQKPIVVLMPAEPVGLDPMFSTSSADITLSINETLFKLDNDGRIIPAAAESIKMVDPLTWEIRLRPGLVFQNDEPVNADAVVFTFDRATTLFAAGQGDLNFAMGALKYSRMEKLDDLTVRLIMKEPDPIVTSHLVNPEFSILPPKYYSENSPEKVAFAPVGLGGYKFVSYEPGVGLVLKAFDKYWQGKPPVDDIVVKAVPEVATRVGEMKAGSADLMTGVPADLKADLEGDGINVVTMSSYLRQFINIKQGRHPALADMRVRQALNYAVDCDEIATELLGGLVKCRIDLVNPPNDDHDLKPYPYDPEKAKKLLDEAGWVPGPDGVRVKDGTRLSLNFDTTGGFYLMDKETAQVLGDDWKAVGIEIKDLKVIDNSVSAQMRANQGAGFRDLMNSGSGPDYTCQGDLLLVHKESGSNRMSWVDDTFEQMFKTFRQEFDQSKWPEMCRAAQAYVAEQAPVVWLFNAPSLYAVSKRLNFHPRADGRLYLGSVLQGEQD